MATAKARTGPSSSKSTPPESSEGGESLAVKAAALIQKAPKSGGKVVVGEAKKAVTVVKNVIPPGQASKIFKLASSVIGRHTEKTYDVKQLPLGLVRSPMSVVSSGSIALDDLIGGNPAPDGTGPICAGYPRRHITEIFGAESSGKTTLSLEAIARCQREGGVAMFLDFEHAIHHGYAQAIGVQFNEQLLLYAPSSMEEGLDMVKIGIKVGVDLIVVDSVAAMVPLADMEKNFNESDQIGSRARKLASALPKVVKILHEPSKENTRGTAVIFINQTRAKIGTTGPASGDTTTTSGGFALRFFAYVRLSVTRIGSEFIEKVDSLTMKKIKRPYGNKTLIKVVKSKADAKQGHTAEIFIRYGKGIDDYYSIINTGVAHGVIKKAGAYYDYGPHHIQGREKFRSLLLQNTQLFEEVQAAVLQAIRAQAADIDLSDEDEENFDEILAASVGEDDERSPPQAVSEEVLSEAPSDEEDVEL